MSRCSRGSGKKFPSAVGCAMAAAASLTVPFAIAVLVSVSISVPGFVPNVVAARVPGHWVDAGNGMENNTKDVSAVLVRA